jgi:hypothetical protein
MLVARLACCAALALVALPPGPARADCAAEIGKLMSRDTEKLTTRYNRFSARMEKQGASPKLVAEGCRIARALEPKLVEQISALRQSGCSKDPNVGTMVADIVRGHEADLAAMRKTTASACR